MVIAIVAGTAFSLLILCPCGVALLLPAVQQAREAARRAAAKNEQQAADSTAANSPVGQTPTAHDMRPAAGTSAPSNSATSNAAPAATPKVVETDEATKNRRAATRSLQQIALACHNVHDIHQHFPPIATADKPIAGEVPQSWMTDILQYGPNAPLYAKINRKVAWNDPQSAAPFQTVVDNYVNPAVTGDQKDASGYALAHFAANSQMISDQQWRAIRDITDGASNTMLIGTVTEGFKPWGDPTNHRDAARGFGGGPTAFGAANNGQALIVMADGSVRMVNPKIDASIAESLASPNDGKAFNGNTLPLSK